VVSLLGCCCAGLPPSARLGRKRHSRATVGNRSHTTKPRPLGSVVDSQPLGAALAWLSFSRHRLRESVVPRARTATQRPSVCRPTRHALDGKRPVARFMAVSLASCVVLPSGRAAVDWPPAPGPQPCRSSWVPAQPAGMAARPALGSGSLPLAVCECSPVGLSCLLLATQQQSRQPAAGGRLTPHHDPAAGHAVCRVRLRAANGRHRAQPPAMPHRYAAAGIR